MGILNKPLLSIITVNLNNCSGLEKTINSVINQNTNIFEHIIIDGCSNDGSVGVIKNNSEKITYWVSEKDNGIYDAMNKGVKAAKGDYCLFLNSGDVFNDKDTINQLAKENLFGDIVNFNAFVVGVSQPKTLVRSKKTIRFYDFYKHTIIHQATLIKKELFMSVGLYNESLKIVADWEFFLKALFIKNCTYQSFDIILSVFDSDGISSRPENIKISLTERRNVLEMHFGRFLKDYKLINDRSTYKYLSFINSSRYLKSIFSFKTKVTNKILGCFIKIE
ncbi:MAG: glycosyltransferase family 2 protein [Bacteroidota bacterium]|nr:glycosyltransferase family 2 protein [Bacteroidota bacterium]MDP3144347.1 glycosyltransferase family 2 protein [Bacteroidota bacterium]